MGVKTTCALIFLSGIVYLAVDATSSQHTEAEISFQPAIADEAHVVGESFPMNRKKRESTHIVKDDGHGNRQESRTFSDKSGSGFASSFSSSSSSGGGGGGGAKAAHSGSGSSGVGSRSSFSESENSQPHKSGQDSSHGGSKKQNSPNGGAQVPDWSHGNFPGQEWAHGGFPGNNGFGGNFRGPNIGPPASQQFVPNVGSPPNNYPYRNPALYNAPGFNFEDPIEQYFRNIEEQQRQLHARLRGPYQSGSNSWAHAAAFTTSPNGRVQPNPRSYSYSWSSTPVQSTGETGTGAGYTMRQHNQAVNNQQRFYDMNNAIEYGSPVNNYYPNPYGFGSRGGFGADFGNFDNFNQGFPNSAGGGFPNFFSGSQGGNGAFASASLGPNGGFRQAEVRPGSPGIESRFAEEAPPPSGQTYGVFTSSSSGSQTDANGKEMHYNRATTGINDNGKISFRTVHDR